jgi:antitoxin ParD1/3/4
MRVERVDTIKLVISGVAKKMNIYLKPEQEQFIQEQLKTGRYNTADEVIAEAFRLLKERETINQRRLEELRQKIASGTEQIAKGQVTDGEVVFAKLQEKIRSISEPKA